MKSAFRANNCFQETIDNIHKAAKEGDLNIVKQLMTTKRLALARDRHGCTPLHTAMIYEQSEIIRFIAAQFPSVLNAPDYVRRSPTLWTRALFPYPLSTGFRTSAQQCTTLQRQGMVVTTSRSSRRREQIQWRWIMYVNAFSSSPVQDFRKDVRLTTTVETRSLT